MSRREFSRSVMAAAAMRANGHCEQCTRKLLSGDFHFDHIIPDALGGEPTLENCAVLCRACHGEKTARIDVPRIAKAKRREAIHIGAKRSKRPMPGSKASGWKRRMDGTIVPRERP